MGCDMESATVVPAGTPDDAAVDEVMHSSGSVLLVPFHGHRDESGEMINGFSFLAKLVERKGSCPWKIVMPVSRYGRAGFMLAEARLPDRTFGGQLEVVVVEDLDEFATANRLRAHVR